jgi:hypothetical protein
VCVCVCTSVGDGCEAHTSDAPATLEVLAHLYNMEYITDKSLRGALEESVCASQKVTPSALRRLRELMIYAYIIYKVM